MATAVEFVVQAEVLHGEKVVVVGNCHQIGNWDVARGIFMETSIESFPLWRAHVELPANTTVQYKYVLVESGRMSPPDSPSAISQYKQFYSHWEDPPFINRTLETGPAGSTMEINDGFFGMRHSAGSLLKLCHKGSLHSDFGETKSINIPSSRWKNLGFGKLSSTTMLRATLLAITRTGLTNIMDTTQLSSMIAALHSESRMSLCLQQLCSEGAEDLSVDSPAYEISDWVRNFNFENKGSSTCILRNIMVGETSAGGTGCVEESFNGRELKFVCEERDFRNGDQFFVELGKSQFSLENWRKKWQWEKGDEIHGVVIGGFRGLPWALCVPTVMTADGGPFGKGRTLLLITFEDSVVNFPSQYTPITQTVCRQVLDPIL